MDRMCVRCHSLHPAHANFCAVCGMRLITSPRRSPVRIGRLLLAVIVAALVTLGVFAGARSPRVTLSREFLLPHSKAEGIFELLRPRSVKVIVARRPNGVRISGTRDEIDAVSDFLHLLTRNEACLSDDLEPHMAKARPGWTDRETYRLSSAMAKVLYDTLAPKDVPVLVYRSGRRIRVDASADDQETIQRMVAILRGRDP